MSGRDLKFKYAPSAERGRHWSEDALCLTEDPEIFFPASKRNFDTERARKICVQCPVILECLQDALRMKNSDQDGVLGGLTADERIKLRKRVSQGKLPEFTLRHMVQMKINQR